MIYLIIFLYISLLTYLYDYRRITKNKEFNYWAYYVVLVLLAGLRYRVGGDTIAYILSYEYLTPDLDHLDIWDISRRQPIPSFLFSFVKTYLHDFTYIQILIAIFVNTVIFWFIKNNTKYCFTALFLYTICFYPRLNFEILRESMAVAFFLLGYRYLISGKYLRYYVYIIFAFLCHASAIFLFALPFIFSSINLVWKIPLIVGTIIFVFILSYVYNVFDLISFYLETYEEYDSTIYGKFSIIIFQIIIPVYFIKKSINCSSKEIISGVWIYILSGVLSLVMYIFYRFNNYSMIFYIIMVADLLNYTLKKYRYSYNALLPNLIYIFIFCFCFVSPYFSTATNKIGIQQKWYSRWYPYYSVIDPQEDYDREAFVMKPIE